MYLPVCHVKHAPAINIIVCKIIFFCFHSYSMPYHDPPFLSLSVFLEQRLGLYDVAGDVLDWNSRGIIWPGKTPFKGFGVLT